MKYFAILTLVMGNAQTTVHSVVTVQPPATREAIFNYLRDQVVANSGPQWGKATVVYFTAEPDALSS